MQLLKGDATDVIKIIIHNIFKGILTLHTCLHLRKRIHIVMCSRLKYIGGDFERRRST